MDENQKDVVTRRMFIKGMATSFGALPVFAWPRWAQAFYYNLGFFKKGSAASIYVEDVFSTYIYTGNTSVQTITNGIDLAGKGGLVWIKGKDSVRNHIFRDSARGLTNGLSSNLIDAQVNWVGMGSFNTTGFTLGDDGTPGTNTQSGNLNQSGVKFVSWTFRKAAKFFDIVTYTGNGSAPRTLSHSLGIAPGMVIIKRTSAGGNWWVYHRSSPNQGAAYTGIGGNLYLDTTDAADTGVNPALSAVSASSITLSTNQNLVLNISGEAYVAYLFAHDTAADGIIQCGSFTTDASGNATVSLGWEPQFVIYKYVSSGTAVGWTMLDTTRGWINSTTTNSDMQLFANSSNAESSGNHGHPTATGFAFTNANLAANQNLVYLAIRRGLMKTPTSGTQVYQAVVQNGTGTNPRILTGVAFPPDLMIISDRSGTGAKHIFYDRLRGPNSSLAAYSNSSDTGLFGGSDGVTLTQDGVNIANIATALNGGVSFVHHFFRRAPGFFDIVCYTGVGGNPNIAHNLGVVPELIIGKKRTAINPGQDWYAKYSGFATPGTFILLNSSAAAVDGAAKFTNLTSTKFDASNQAAENTDTYVAYLFASCPGVSKVGSYTGNGGTGDSGLQQIINCGFTSGARFIMIKRTDNVGDWYVWDTARGIAAGNDPHLSFNTTAAEVTTDSSINYDASGFIVSQASATNINVTGATYIFMAIA